MRAGLGSAALVVALAAAAGCDDDAGNPSYDDSASTRGGTLTDPLTFGESGTGCVTDPGTYLYYAQLTTEEALTLTGVDLLAPRRSRITASWLAERPEGAIPRAGLVRGVRPFPDDVADTGWPQRRPLANSTLEPGVDYEFFLEMALRRPGGYDAIDVAWTGESGRGTSRLEDRLETREGCT
jgi:hypothetical protein